MRALALVPLLLLTGCPGSSLTTCGAEPDLTGHWTISLYTLSSGGGIPRPDTLEADLRQVKRPNSDLGALVWGTLVSEDKGFFDTLTIPELTRNNGSKTGGVVGCEVKINVPVAMTVSDDDVDNGPLRLSLTGSIVGAGRITGEPSSLIRVENVAMMPETFLWSAQQR